MTSAGQRWGRWMGFSLLGLLVGILLAAALVVAIIVGAMMNGVDEQAVNGFVENLQNNPQSWGVYALGLGILVAMGVPYAFFQAASLRREMPALSRWRWTAIFIVISILYISGETYLSRTYPDLFPEENVWRSLAFNALWGLLFSGTLWLFLLRRRADGPGPWFLWNILGWIASALLISGASGQTFIANSAEATNGVMGIVGFLIAIGLSGLGAALLKPKADVSHYAAVFSDEPA